MDRQALPVPIAACDVLDWRMVYKKKLEVEENWRQGLSSVKTIKGGILSFRTNSNVTLPACNFVKTCTVHRDIKVF